MALVGYILFAVGLVMSLLTFTTFIDLIPPLAALNVPLAVWIGVAVIGVIVALMYRRARD